MHHLLCLPWHCTTNEAEGQEKEEIKRKKKKRKQKKNNKQTEDETQGDGEGSNNDDEEEAEGVTPEGWDVWVGNHDCFQMKAAISNKDNCISRLCNDWSRAA